MRRALTALRWRNANFASSVSTVLGEQRAQLLARSTTPNVDKVALTNCIEGRERAWKERSANYWAEREQENNAWWGRYNDHLASEKWERMRARRRTRGCLQESQRKCITSPTGMSAKNSPSSSSPSATFVTRDFTRKNHEDQHRIAQPCADHSLVRKRGSGKSTLAFKSENPVAILTERGVPRASRSCVRRDRQEMKTCSSASAI